MTTRRIRVTEIELARGRRLLKKRLAELAMCGVSVLENYSPIPIALCKFFDDGVGHELTVDPLGLLKRAGVTRPKMA